MSMMKNVPLKKQSKKQQRQHYAARRGDWNGVVPVTKVIPDKKKQKLRRITASFSEEDR